MLIPYNFLEFYLHQLDGTVEGAPIGSTGLSVDDLVFRSWTLLGVLGIDIYDEREEKEPLPEIRSHFDGFAKV